MAVEKYSLASSIKKNERRLIAVASGFDTKNERSRQSSKLLTWGITNFDLIKIAGSNTSLTDLEVWLGKSNSVSVYTQNDVFTTIKKLERKKLRHLLNMKDLLKRL